MEQDLRENMLSRLKIDVWAIFSRGVLHAVNIERILHWLWSKIKS